MSRARPRPFLEAALLALLPLLALALPPYASAQRRIVSPAGDTLAFSEDELRTMLDTTRALRRDLEEDPRVLYYTGTGPVVPADDPEGAYPWEAVDVLADSVATIRTPGNLREADRAYANYAVLRMRHVRADPDVSCDSIFAREVRAVSGFLDGWIASRTLFGAPPYSPLDELVFASRAGALPGLLAAHGDPQVGGCLRVWIEAHPEAVEAYRAWRETAFRRDPGGPSAGAAAGRPPQAGTNAATRPIQVGTTGRREVSPPAVLRGPPMPRTARPTSAGR